MAGNLSLQDVVDITTSLERAIADVLLIYQQITGMTVRRISVQNVELMDGTIINTQVELDAVLERRSVERHSDE